MTIFTRSDDVIPSGVRRLSLNSSWETLALCKAGLLVKSFEISSSLQPHFLRTSKGLSLTPSTRCFTSLTHNVEHLVVMVADKWFLLTKLELVESNLIKDNRFIFPVECISIKEQTFTNNQTTQAVTFNKRNQMLQELWENSFTPTMKRRRRRKRWRVIMWWWCAPQRVFGPGLATIVFVSERVWGESYCGPKHKLM